MTDPAAIAALLIRALHQVRVPMGDRAQSDERVCELCQREHPPASPLCRINCFCHDARAMIAELRKEPAPAAIDEPWRPLLTSIEGILASDSDAARELEKFLTEYIGIGRGDPRPARRKRG